MGMGAMPELQTRRIREFAARLRVEPGRKVGFLTTSTPGSSPAPSQVGIRVRQALAEGRRSRAPEAIATDAKAVGPTRRAAGKGNKPKMSDKSTWQRNGRRTRDG